MTRQWLISIFCVLAACQNDTPSEPVKPAAKTKSANEKTVIASPIKKFAQEPIAPIEESKTKEVYDVTARIHPYRYSDNENPSPLPPLETDVFNHISAVLKGQGRQAIVITSDVSFLISINTKHKVVLGYDGDKLTCKPLSLFIDPIAIGPLTYHTHASELEGLYKKIAIRGRKRYDCLTLIDVDNSEYIAVFPTKQTVEDMYRLMRPIVFDEAVNTSLVWLDRHPIDAKGVIAKLKAPIEACSHIRHAILLKDSPVFSDYSVNFPN